MDSQNTQLGPPIGSERLAVIPNPAIEAVDLEGYGGLKHADLRSLTPKLVAPEPAKELISLVIDKRAFESDSEIVWLEGDTVEDLIVGLAKLNPKTKLRSITGVERIPSRNVLQFRTGNPKRDLGKSYKVHSDGAVEDTTPIPADAPKPASADDPALIDRPFE